MSTGPPGNKPSDPFEDFLRGFAHIESSHPRSWDLFYRFILRAHAKRKGWGYLDVRDRLVKHGLSEEKATMYSEVYWHGRCVLHLRKRHGKRYAYADWVRKGATRLT